MYIQLLKSKKNIILHGAPGTGKTYNTAAIALSLIEEYQNEKTDYTDHKAVMENYQSYVKNGRIGFVTFHESMDYEDFVEGLSPEKKHLSGSPYRTVEDGIFKSICLEAKSDRGNPYVLIEEPYILIIDEINRGNLSKIFGELITLLEANNRSGGNHPLSVRLRYSGDNFEVPSNLYIIGTMNTTDRSVGTIDYVIRRRFAFVTLEASEDAINSYYENKDTVLKGYAIDFFTKIKTFLLSAESDMDISDLMVGHSYFMANDIDELKMKLEFEIIPLIQEYYKDCVIAVNPKDAIEEWRKNLL